MTKKQSIIALVTLLTVAAICAGTFWYALKLTNTSNTPAQQSEIDALLKARRANIDNTKKTDPFGEDERVTVLLLGLDSRIGETSSHCDAIQLLDIDKKNESVTITAVPRGTYSPLPPGTGTTSTDYYVSNACALGGLDYGIKQIERILGQEADYVAMVGFSQMTGILRHLDLPTTETLQWLRNRQGYQIGEPQRARNHSTFLKHVLTKYTPNDISKVDSALHYIVYKIVDTDLTFGETKTIVQALSDIELAEHSEKVHLAMRPAYDVQDISYDPETIDKHLKQTIGRIKHLLSPDAYEDISEEDIQKQILTTIEEQKEDPSFVTWAYENSLWLQISDEEKRNGVRFDLMKRYTDHLNSIDKRKEILSDYILEMEHLNHDVWATRGKILLERVVED